ncbi:MAG: PAS domain S-box protein, partial [Dehalococcoidia bacterium]
MVRKERKKEPKKDKSKADKKPVAEKKARLPKAAKVEKTESTPVAEMRSMPPIIEILSDARLGICFFNKNDEVEYINRHFTEITGLPLEKLAGKKLRKNALWGSRGQEDEFQALFIEARESGKNLVREHLSVGSGKEDQRYWTLNLLPQSDGKSEYSGMYLVIEELSDIRPSASMMDLINGFQQAALHHNDEQSLLDELAGILKDFSRCSYIKMAIVNKTGDGVIKAETGKEQGLWDVDQTLSADSINRIFEMNGEEAPSYRTNRGSIYLEDIGQVEDSLKGTLQELVVDLRNSYGFRSLAFVPVKTDSNITGLIQLANKKAGGIPEEVLDSIEIISDQLKVILDRMELQDEVRRQRESLLRQMHVRSAHLEALSERLKQEISERKKRQDEMRVQRDLAVKLNGIVNMDEALKLCLDTAIEVGGADSGGIYIVDRHSGELILRSSKGLSDEFLAAITLYDASSANYQMIMEMKPIYSLVDNLGTPTDDLYVAEGLKGAGLVPIVYHDKAIGCLNIASHIYNEIPENTRDALETVSAQIGSVITRIQDRKELEDTVERYSTLFERSANPILILDSDGKYLDGNGAALAFLECTREELKAMHVRDTLPPYLDENWFQQYRDSWERGGKVERDYYVWGKIKVMELVITSLPLEKDRIVICVGTDITERKRIEAALQRSEEKYRTHVNSVTDVIYSVDPDHTIMDVSPSVERLLGYKPEELIGHHFNEINLLAPESLPVAYDNLIVILSGGHIENSEYQFIARDGTKKYAEINGAPLYSGDKIIGTISVARDITERKRAQEALHKSEEQYRILAENIMDIVCLLDTDFHITWITQSGEKISGYTAEEMKTMPFDKL